MNWLKNIPFILHLIFATDNDIRIQCQYDRDYIYETAYNTSNGNSYQEMWLAENLYNENKKSLKKYLRNYLTDTMANVVVLYGHGNYDFAKKDIGLVVNKETSNDSEKIIYLNEVIGEIENSIRTKIPIILVLHFCTEVSWKHFSLKTMNKDSLLNKTEFNKGLLEYDRLIQNKEVFTSTKTKNNTLFKYLKEQYNKENEWSKRLKKLIEKLNDSNLENPYLIYTFGKTANRGADTRGFSQAIESLKILLESPKQSKKKISLEEFIEIIKKTDSKHDGQLHYLNNKKNIINRFLQGKTISY